MPGVDMSMVEQRYDAVKKVLDGATVKATAARHGVGSPLTESCSEPIVLDTTGAKSSERYSTEGQTQKDPLVRHTYRCQSETRVVRLHKTAGQKKAAPTAPPRLARPAIVAITGMSKPGMITFSESDYKKVKALGDEHRSNTPPVHRDLDAASRGPRPPSPAPVGGPPQPVRSGPGS